MRIVLIFSLILMQVAGIQLNANQQEQLKGKITVSGAFALYPLMQVWAEQFRKEYPQVGIDISAGGAGKGMADVLSGMVDIGMVSRDLHPGEKEKGAIDIRVAKDGVVVIVSSVHPALSQIMRRGIKKRELQAIFIDEKIKFWEQLNLSGCPGRINVFTRSDSCGAAETFAHFLDKKQEDLNGTGVYGDPGVVEAVRRDPLSIGYCNINFGYDARTLTEVEGVKVLPLDLNSDGKISVEENFYQNRDDLTTAIANGRYPSPPARDLYLVVRGKNQSAVVKSFLKWILSSGQKYVTQAGYVLLSPEMIRGELQKIN